MANNQQLLLGEGAGSAPAVFVEDVFSTYLYTGNGSTQTITNNIDLSTKGGLVWSKDRSGTNSHRLYDTVRGGNKSLSTNQTAAQDTWSAPYIMTFNSNGYETGLLNNESSFKYASWTFRKQPKFFDIVTYTGNGSNQTISHSLGAAPGCIIVKCTSDGITNWFVYHSSLAVTSGRPGFLYLDSTSAVQTGDPTVWPSVPTSTTFEVGSYNALNGSGRTYVAYLFAHNAGGFGLAGTDNVISCGSFSGGGTTVNLGWEPQWILAKRTDTTGDWYIDDNMRGWPAAGSNDNPLLANSSSAEPSGYAGFSNITSTGFTNNFNGDYIYIAIRRGPMKVPTVGTSVYKPIARTSTGSATAVTGVGFTPDASLIKRRDNTANNVFVDRLRGRNLLRADNTGAEIAASSAGRDLDSFDMDGISIGTNWNVDLNAGGGATYIDHFFRRAPGFFDEVCYTGNGTAPMNVPHSLGVTPQLIIIKKRNGAEGWNVFNSVISDAYGGTGRLFLNTTAAYSSTGWVAPIATSTAITLDTGYFNNQTGDTYVAYLFATCAGVSKVGSYTGNGSSQTIACGFAAGSRFVMIKRTDSTGDWYVWDSARGIIAGNDPHLSLNTTAAEVTTDDSVDTDNSGFIVNQDAATNVNVSSATYIFLAIS